MSNTTSSTPWAMIGAKIGTGAMRRYALRLEHLKMDGAPLAVSLLAMLGLAALSDSIGLAAIIGAFLAGMVFAEAREHFEQQSPGALSRRRKNCYSSC